MSEDGGVVRRIAWREICPWLILFRSFRLSISLPILFLATIGWLLTPLGPQLGASLFLGTSPVTATGWSTNLEGATSFAATIQEMPLLSSLTSLSNPITYVYQHFTSPLLRALDRGNSIPEVAYHLFCGLWNLGVWAFFAGAITRIAALQLGRDERVDLRGALKYAGRAYGWSFVAPLFPLFGVLLAGLPVALLGIAMRADVGMVAAGLLWPLVLISGLIMAILMLGLLAGWPLMWPTISSEEHGDAFEAFSRSFSYVFQRPLPYLAYALLALVLGGLGWLLVSAVAEGIIELSLYAASWGASNERIELIPFGEYDGLLGAGVGLVRFFHGVVRMIAMAFNFSFFFCVSTAIYLVLRRDVDNTDLDEVFVEEDRASRNLPAVGTPSPGNSQLRPAADEVNTSVEPAVSANTIRDSDSSPTED